MALEFTLNTSGASSAKTTVEDTMIIHTKKGKIPASAVVAGDYMCIRDDVYVQVDSIATV